MMESCVLGQGPNVGQCPVPRHVFNVGTMIQQVACSSAHTLAASLQGVVWSWGRGSCGQLGHGGDEDRSVPTMVIMETDTAGVESLAAGGRHSVVVTSLGRVLTFGSNENGQLGHGDFGPDIFFPTELQAVTSAGVTKCAAGAHHTLLSTAGGSIFSFGGGERGHRGSFDSDFSDTPFRHAFILASSRC
jgi:E3 ubiquitin-protein ligase HERC4